MVKGDTVPWYLYHQEFPECCLFQVLTDWPYELEPGHEGERYVFDKLGRDQSKVYLAALVDTQLGPQVKRYLNKNRFGLIGAYKNKTTGNWVHLFIRRGSRVKHAGPA